ncbi:hypothetical protein B0H14DRAFT_3708859 [Mycena olivaceomarginata]|nr:hypothetical protein B0H14DRAFT_3708859 [Mycena olivaceomarginata]
MTSISDLPQELVGQIVSELRGDEPNLRTCALVSRVFVPWTRQYLFSSVRLTAANPYAFRILVEQSPDVAAYVRRLDIPLSVDFKHISPIIPSTTLVQLPNITHLSAHSDPFDFRHLSPSQELSLADAARRLTTVEIFIDRLWPLPANNTGWSTWTSVDVALPMPAAPVPGTLHLHTLRVSGDCKILVPLSAWLVPQGALAALHTLVFDVTYLTDDYDAPDARPGLVLAAAPSLRELTLQLDPPMPLEPLEVGDGPVRLASFPRLRVLNLRDGYDATIDESLAWLAAFLLPPASPSSSSYSPRDADSALEELSFDHSMLRADLLAVPAATWCAIEGGLLGFDADGEEGDAHPHHQPHPHLRTVAFTGYQKLASYQTPSIFTRRRRRGVQDPDASFEHFSRTVRERLPRLLERGMLVVGQ